MEQGGNGGRGPERRAGRAKTFPGAAVPVDSGSRRVPGRGCWMDEVNQTPADSSKEKQGLGRDSQTSGKLEF